jgi:hypothetical protein
VARLKWPAKLLLSQTMQRPVCGTLVSGIAEGRQS